MNRKTAAYFFCRLREIIVLELEADSEARFGGEIEVDESDFGGKRKGKRGRGAAGKVPVFGLLKRGARVYTKIIPDASSDVSDFHHFRINHSERLADDRNHINGIENFWSQAKRHMRRFNGIPKAQFGLYLKECEWRFNNSDPAIQLTQLRQWVKRHIR